MSQIPHLKDDLNLLLHGVAHRCSGRCKESERESDSDSDSDSDRGGIELNGEPRCINLVGTDRAAESEAAVSSRGSEPNTRTQATTRQPEQKLSAHLRKQRYANNKYNEYLGE